MPEMPEVETVRKTLLKKLRGYKIESVDVYYPKIIESNLDEFKKLSNKTIKDIIRIGKWLVFDLDDIYMLSHLRMEGKYFIKEKGTKAGFHDLVYFHLDHDTDLIYNDTRRFGALAIVDKDKLYDYPAIKKMGYDPYDEKLTKEYLFEKYQKTRKYIKTVLLDQTIFSGLGNIYANEVLFASNINPYRPANKVTLDECQKIIDNSRKILKKATEAGGTTIRSYTSSLGVTGRFQFDLFVHAREKEVCKVCGEPIICEQINGRSAYYCPKCQSK
ncbi:MAG: bifunctional DNA-formamidopyrimidine glycosylase/DNA-(apurinic or apyrimidinic site) lyase [Bacilli bacterium]|nr:bifunctional DNA-formamidopyrimidine glycosylase/DNA-(apurinic or apyrimidinic site) lyase [Bacilli bacterium]